MVVLSLAMAAAPTGPAEAAANALAERSRAWNAGDLEGAPAACCRRPEIIWVNRSSVSRGFGAFAASMRSAIGDPARMGRTTVQVLDARTVSPESALVWIRRDSSRNGTRHMVGISTQLRSPCGGRMRIVLGHAS